MSTIICKLLVVNVTPWVYLKTHLMSAPMKACIQLASGIRAASPQHGTGNERCEYLWVAITLSPLKLSTKFFLFFGITDASTRSQYLLKYVHKG